MNAANIDASILRFFRDDVGGILITDAAGRNFRTNKNTFTVNQEQRHGVLGTV